jgi:hypothetical protein
LMPVTDWAEVSRLIRAFSLPTKPSCFENYSKSLLFGAILDRLSV